MPKLERGVGKVVQQVGAGSAIQYTQTARWMAQAVSWLVAFYVFGWLGTVGPAPFPSAIRWEPEHGLALALFLMRGPSAAPLVFLGLVVCAAAFSKTLGADIGNLLVWPGTITLLLLGIAWALQRWGRFDSRLRYLRDVALLDLSACGVAFGIVGLKLAADWVNVADFAIPSFRTGLRSWITELLGIFVISPVVLLLFSRARTRIAWPTVANIFEGIAQLGAISWTLWAFATFDQSGEIRLFYLLFLPVIWIAARRGFLGAAPAVAIIQVGLLIATNLWARSAAEIGAIEFRMLILALTGHLLGIAISEQRQSDAERNLLQAALSKIARSNLAGGMTAALAHELGQPLGAITSYGHALRLLLRAPPIDATRLTEVVEKLLGQAMRTRETLTRLRDLFEHGGTEPRKCDFRSLVEECLQQIAGSAENAGVRIKTSIPSSLPMVYLDAMQVQQAILNLLTNAVESLSEYELRERVISVDVAVSDSLLITTISDNGSGIPDDLAEHLFEPFTTSKGRGMGLGLWISRMIVEAQGGALEGRNRPGAGGAEFILKLPLRAGNNG